MRRAFFLLSKYPAKTKRACRKSTAEHCGLRTHAPLQGCVPFFMYGQVSDLCSRLCRVQTRKWGLFRIRTEFPLSIQFTTFRSVRIYIIFSIISNLIFLTRRILKPFDLLPLGADALFLVPLRAVVILWRLNARRLKCTWPRA